MTLCAKVANFNNLAISSTSVIRFKMSRSYAFISQVKELVRKEIEANKKHVQEMRCKPSLVSHSGSSSSASKAATESGLKSESTVISGSKCRIQVSTKGYSVSTLIEQMK